MKPRWKRCAESTDRLLGEALGQKYVEKYFPPEAKARMQELVKNLRLAMKETIEGLDWMSAETKAQGAREALDLQPQDRLSRQVEGLQQGRRSRATRTGTTSSPAASSTSRTTSRTIGKPVDRGRWGMTPPTSDAYYNPLLNEIVFPAGILQPPAFSIEANDAVNYGAIGVVIGHEISHGFDDQGAQYDAQGRLKNWWTDEDLKKFQAKRPVRRRPVRGLLRRARHAPQRQARARRVDRRPRRRPDRLPRLPDLAAGQAAAADDRRLHAGPAVLHRVGPVPRRRDPARDARTMVQGDPHPIAKYRVIGPLSNLPEFQKAFGCKAGSPMVRPEGALRRLVRRRELKRVPRGPGSRGSPIRDACAWTVARRRGRGRDLSAGPALAVVEDDDSLAHVGLSGDRVDEHRDRLALGLRTVGEGPEVHGDHRLRAEVPASPARRRPGRCAASAGTTPA